MITKDIEPEFWSCKEDDERLSHNNIDDAIEDYIESECYDFTITKGTKIEVYGFAQAELDLNPEDILSDVLENIDENYGDPDDMGTIASPVMIEAAKEFCDVIKSEYKVWLCDHVKTETINLYDWCKLNLPDALIEEE